MPDKPLIEFYWFVFTDVNTTWSRSWFPLRIPSAIKEHVTKSLDLSKSPDLTKSPDLQKSDGSDSSIFKRSTRQKRQISPGVYSCGHQVCSLAWLWLWSINIGYSELGFFGLKVTKFKIKFYVFWNKGMRGWSKWLKSDFQIIYFIFLNWFSCKSEYWNRRKTVHVDIIW